MGSPPGHATEPPGPPSPLGSGPRGPRRWLVFWSLAAVALLAAAVLGVVVLRGDESGERATADETAEGTAAEPTVPTEPPTPEEVDDLVAELSAFVEDQRGLEFKQPVQVDIEDDDAFQKRVLDNFDEDADQVEAYDPLYKAVGLLGPDDDLLDVFRAALGAAVIGFYDPESKELVVRGAAITPAVRVTLAHELTHALDDQRFDLDRPEYDDADDEIGFGFSAVAEGNATVVENAYLASLSEAEREQYFEEQLAYDIPDVPPWLFEQIGAPYQYGQELVGALRDKGGRERLDAAFTDPPRTSEQVLHPELFLDGQPVVEVTNPQADGEVAWDGVLGELFIGMTLRDEVPDEAQDAARGWGGDWATSWRDGDRSCMRATMVGDTPDDSDELHQAWSDWAAAVDVTATVEQPDPGGPVTLSSCSARGA